MILADLAYKKKIYRMKIQGFEFDYYVTKSTDL